MFALMSTDTRPRVFTPPQWLNAVTCAMLRTPGLQRVVGRSTALITFVGRKSGDVYTTPVTYTRRGNKVIMTCDPSRQWWRNLRSHPGVHLRLAGEICTGNARVLRGSDALADLIEYFEDRPMAARAAGIGRGHSGRLDGRAVESSLPYTVVVVVHLTSNGSPVPSMQRGLLGAAIKPSPCGYTPCTCEGVN